MREMFEGNPIKNIIIQKLPFIFRLNQTMPFFLTEGGRGFNFNKYLLSTLPCIDITCGNITVFGSSQVLIKLFCYNFYMMLSMLGLVK